MCILVYDSAIAQFYLSCNSGSYSQVLTLFITYKSLLAKQIQFYNTDVSYNMHLEAQICEICICP